MKSIVTRFGEVTYDPEQVIYFPRGLIGFEDLISFVVMPRSKDGPLFWLQSVDDSKMAFIVCDPTCFFLDYCIMPEHYERSLLGLETNEHCFVLSIVTVHSDQKITFNLQAPILFSARTRRAMQVILENSEYNVRTPLPSAKTG
jgi:flagellar assembly factor FliW